VQEPKVGDVIYSRCNRSGCETVHGFTLLEKHRDGSFIDCEFEDFVPFPQPILINGNRMWTPEGVVDIIRIERGAGYGDVELYKQYRSSLAAMKAQALSDDVLASVRERRYNDFELISALIYSDEVNYTGVMALVLRMAGVTVTPEQLAIIAAPLIAEEHRKGEKRKDQLHSLLEGVFGGRLRSIGVELVPVGPEPGNGEAPSMDG